eukprot:TRINITY_DN1573_c0_g1_i1.p1 TRINITY_DN1573_c0_g1~~TRINITY_DN1573_c0_g1_i1.p1  ORF type:complete len:1282 (+),score=493.70 TRINITY_DN1573_c0_g1_i1:374-3847(+)
MDELWKDFEGRLAAQNVPLDSLLGATTSTVHEALRDLGYDALTSARIQTEMQYRKTPPPPADAAPAPVDPPSAPADGVGAGGGGGGGAGSGPPLDLTFADGTTSVTGLDDDSVLRAAQRAMEDEIKKLDAELGSLRKQIADGKPTGAAGDGKEKETDKDKDKDKDGKGKDKDKDGKGKDKDGAGGVTGGGAGGGDPSIPYPELSTRVPAELWPVLIERLAACGLSEADIETCTPLTFEKVLLYLSFNPLERARLIQEFTARFGANAANAGPGPVDEDPPPKPPVGLDDVDSEIDHDATPADILDVPTGANTQYAGQNVYDNIGTNLRGEPLLIDPSKLHRWPNYHHPGMPLIPATGSAASAMPPSESGFGDDAFAPLIKCPAHPDRAVEFWCVECETLVCSLCHVSGFHKDHPFMPITEAARKELGGLADWQMRAATVSTKLEDTSVSLDEVHQNIDDYHQGQIDTVVDTIDRIKEQLEEHKNSLVKRIQGHAAAQHQLFRPVEERVRHLRTTISKGVNKMDQLLVSNPDSMSDDDANRWAQGVMDVRSTLGSTFADAAGHPITIPNYTNLKFNNEWIPDDMYAKIFLTKVPTPTGIPSYIDMAELKHPFHSNRDRINFSWAQPDVPDYEQAVVDKSPIALSNNNLTASYDGAGSGHILFKGTATFEGGRHYWEVRLDALHNDNRLGTHAIVGLVAEGTESMGSQTGLAWCVDKLSGIVPMALDCPPWVPGSLLGVFLDLDLNRVGLYFNKQCVAHVAIPPGRYTPAASIHCHYDQVTLIPTADIPMGVSLTSGMQNRKGAYKLPLPGQTALAAGGALAGGVLPGAFINAAPEDAELSFLQDECVKLRQNVNDAKRDILEQKRVQAQQHFQESQVRDLKSKIDETARAMAQQAMDFEKQSAEDFMKLQDYQREQLENEARRAAQMQQDTARRAAEVKLAQDQQKDQSEKLEKFLVEQQVQITQQMLERQKLQEEEQTKAKAAAHQKAQHEQQLLNQQLLHHQRVLSTLQAQGQPPPPTAAGSPPQPLATPVFLAGTSQLGQQPAHAAAPLYPLSTNTPLGAKASRPAEGAGDPRNVSPPRAGRQPSPHTLFPAPAAAAARRPSPSLQHATSPPYMGPPAGLNPPRGYAGSPLAPGALQQDSTAALRDLIQQARGLTR